MVNNYNTKLKNKNCNKLRDSIQSIFLLFGSEKNDHCINNKSSLWKYGQRLQKREKRESFLCSHVPFNLPWNNFTGLVTVIDCIACILYIDAKLEIKKENYICCCCCCQFLRVMMEAHFLDSSESPRSKCLGFGSWSLP